MAFSYTKIFVRHISLIKTMSHHKVFVTRALPSQAQARFDDLSSIYDIDIWTEDRPISREELKKRVQGAHGILCTLNDKIDKDILESAGPQLRVISTNSVGYDHIDTDELKKRNILLGNTPDVLTDATADTTVLLILAAARRMKESIRAVENGTWGPWSPTWLLGTQFTNKTLGIVGLGRVGVAVAHRMRAFGIGKILYHGRREKPDIASQLSATFVNFDTLLKESDVVCSCTALTNETRELFNYAAFARMKKTAIFVNSARGGIVHQNDLVNALSEKLIFAAGLDVTNPEPLPLSSPLLKLDNCIVTPHIGSATWETRTEMGLLAIDNLIAGLQGQPLPSSVL